MMGQAISDVAAMADVVGEIFRGGRFEAHQRAHRMGTGLIRCEKHGMVEVGFRPVEQEDGTSSFALSACKLCRDEAQAEAERSKAEARAKDLRDRELQERLGQSNLPLRFQSKTFANFEPHCAKAADALAKCKAYAEGFDSVMERGQCLIMTGKVGTGKTHLAAAIANHLIHERKDYPLFVSVSQAVRSIKETWQKNSEHTESEALQWFVEPDLLILDEVGVQFGSETERFLMFEIINQRYINVKPTVVLSNLTLAEIAQVMGDRVVDRLREGGGFAIEFNWGSYRERSR